MDLPFPRRFSAGDQRQDLLGECNDDAARDGQNAVCALRRIVRLERQTNLQEPKPSRIRPTARIREKMNSLRLFTTASGSPSAANAGTTKTASMKNTLAQIE